MISCPGSDMIAMVVCHEISNYGNTWNNIIKRILVQQLII